MDPWILRAHGHLSAGTPRHLYTIGKTLVVRRLRSSSSTPLRRSIRSGAPAVTRLLAWGLIRAFLWPTLTFRAHGWPVACGRASRLPVPREATQRSMGEAPTAAKAPRVLPALLTRTDTIRRNYQAAPSDRGLGLLAATRCRCGRCGQCTYPGTA
ncbi:hypothetical protein B0H11DRAFT_2271102 [Mycena galericulata]|nr:hypothetical protein B0H11DRAFT_2271102 [Mycena galericulata]